jgi:bifunctional non-homologous end joining protein LigD
VPDKSAEVVAVVVDGRRLQLSNLDKVMYPATGTTKGEVLNYYARVAQFLLPHLADRPVTRIRWPHGTGAPSFFEKNLPPGAPSWLRSCSPDLSREPRLAGAARPPVAL